ncbi:NAD(P)H-binding protein [Streptomyces sp. NPDC093510]|uniref:NmrA family NAD(P)-binding protein n=1 Tax=Streptomyces sp. NPDC093510 TaxID=3155199 RepID=UPI003425FB36
MPDTVLVTGATGTVGCHVVELLRAREPTVRALVRSAGAAAALPAGVETVSGDLTDPAAVSRALDGVHTALVLLAEDAGEAFARAARRAAGLRHLVVLSADAPDGSAHRGPLFARHAQGEAWLLATGIPVTVLRLAPFATQAHAWAADLSAGDVIGVVHPDLAVPVIDPRDVAEVAATVLRGPAPADRRVLALSGPQLLDVPARVDILGEVLGRKLAVRRLDPDEWVRRCAPRLPEAYARGLLDVERYLYERRLPVVQTVREITGRPPLPFRVWAEDHAAAFGAPDRGQLFEEAV